MSWRLLILLIFLVPHGCSRPADLISPKVDGELAYKLVAQLAEHGYRPSGSKKLQQQAVFIAKTAKDFGAKVATQEFSAHTPVGKITFRNVIAEIKGASDDFIVVGCHYDTKRLVLSPNFVGANDGASGVGLLLAMIKTMSISKEKPPFSVRCVFFDGEECFNSYTPTDGLYGSRYYLKALEKQPETLKKLRAVIILDMIGDRDLKVTLPQKSDSRLAEALLAISSEQGTRKYFGWYPSDIIDDHTPFQEAGIPAIDIIDFEFGQGNCYWHTPEDSMDKIDKKSLSIVGNAALALIWRVDRILN